MTLFSPIVLTMVSSISKVSTSSLKFYYHDDTPWQLENKIKEWEKRSSPSAPSLWQEGIRLLKHLWVAMDGMADINHTKIFRNMKPHERGVLHKHTERHIHIIFILLNIMWVTNLALKCFPGLLLNACVTLHCILHVYMQWKWHNCKKETFDSFPHKDNIWQKGERVKNPFKPQWIGPTFNSE